MGPGDEASSAGEKCFRWWCVALDRHSTKYSGKVTYQIACIADVYITAHNSSNITVIK